MSEKSKRYMLIFTILFILGLVGFRFFYKKYMMSESKETCGYFYRELNYTRSDYFVFTYYVKGKKMEGKLSQESSKIEYLRDLRDLGCVKIRYSIKSPDVTEVVDKRIID